ncbi:MAG: histidinol-phosphate transaminase [Halioglobus sp.]|nr:histidinol-phosphate transaminase [Halioglobus sp.]
MSRYWSDVVSTLTPYVPGEQPLSDKLVKLNTNESPYPPSPRVLEAISAVSADALRLYPDPESFVLREAIATRFGLQTEQVFVGNGSDEVIALAFMALFKHRLPLYFPDVSYSFYPVWSALFDIASNAIPLEADFSIDPASYPAKNGGIIIPNPNAPTGMLMGLDSIRALLQRSAESVVVIDEAYIDFGGDSAAKLIDEYDNLLVVQTLSKSRALAGLRVGFAMGSETLIEALGRVKNSFNSYPLDIVAQRAALASIGDENYFRNTCERVINTRNILCSGMTELGFDILPSVANFILASHRQYSARELFSGLRDQGILVRYFDKPRIDNHLRITIGTDENNEALLIALRTVMGNG